jgi:E3 ubiquitin-protein ligase HUWE1
LIYRKHTNTYLGFHEIIPAELVAIFNEQELELLISGLPEIDVDDWKSNTEYHNYTGASPQIQWFWRAIRSFDKEERAKLLQFVTGTSKVPLNGFKELEGMNGFSRFNIHRDYGNKDRLPSSHTCFNRKLFLCTSLLQISLMYVKNLTFPNTRATRPCVIASSQP